MSQHIDPPATQTGLEGLASTVSALTNKVNSCFTWHNSTVGSASTSTANTWENTNLTIVVPANHVYIGALNGGWNSGKPIGIGVHHKSTLTDDGNIPNQCIQSADGAYSVTVFLWPGTWYVYAKRGTAPTTANNYYFRYIDVYTN